MNHRCYRSVPPKRSSHYRIETYKTIKYFVPDDAAEVAVAEIELELTMAAFGLAMTREELGIMIEDEDVATTSD